MYGRCAVPNQHQPGMTHMPRPLTNFERPGTHGDRRPSQRGLRRPARTLLPPWFRVRERRALPGTFRSRSRACWPGGHGSGIHYHAVRSRRQAVLASAPSNGSLRGIDAPSASHASGSGTSSINTTRNNVLLAGSLTMLTVGYATLRARVLRRCIPARSR